MHSRSPNILKLHINFTRVNIYKEGMPENRKTKFQAFELWSHTYMFIISSITSPMIFCSKAILPKLILYMRIKVKKSQGKFVINYQN